MSKQGPIDVLMARLRALSAVTGGGSPYVNGTSGILKLMNDTTTEFSFVLKPSTIPGAGVGVFAVHVIRKDTHLRLFGDKSTGEERIRSIQKSAVPKLFHEYCKDMGEEMICPQDFGHMSLGWYMNHSSAPNAHHIQYDWYASRDIQAGEEILIDYNTLREPEEVKDEYYKV